MNSRSSIIDISGNFEESLIQLSRHLGTDKIRRAVFNNIYGRGTRSKSKRQIMDALALGDSKGQQVQNALEELSKHRLITKTENNGSVPDGSRFLYGKDPTVGANRDRIVRFADNKKLAARTQTKRSVGALPVVSVRRTKASSLKARKKLVVLFLTSNPDPKYPLRVDAEMRRVQEAIRGSKFRDSVNIEYRPAADLDSILDGLNDLKPQIVHFSGHGDPIGIVADSGKVSANPAPLQSYDTHVSYELLAKALKATVAPPTILLLNSCWGSKGERSLKPAVRFLISMNAPISDIAATVFAPRFYAAIASGQSVKASFDQAVLAVEVASISDATTPELFTAEDPSLTTLT